MFFAVASILFVLGCGVVVYLFVDLRARRIVNDRLSAGFGQQAAADATAPIPNTPRRFARRHYLLPWLPAIALFFISHEAFHLAWSFAAAFGILLGLLLGQLDAMLLTRATSRIENQLADVIDLMVSSLKVGAALQTALENALRESRNPLRPQLEELVGRIRLGDDPRSAVAGLAERVPLETFHLFATALTAHWDVGGSLAGTLATVGRVIRDRIEISQRLRSLTTQARASVIAVLVTTYFIAALMWRNNPGRMSHFLAADIGQWMAAFSIAMQGVGIVWISYLRNVRY